MSINNALLNISAMKGVAESFSNSSTSMAYYLLPSCTAIAYAYEMLGFVVPGKSQSTNPFRVLIHCAGLLLMLLLYKPLVGFISATAASIASSIALNSGVTILWQGFIDSLKNDNNDKISLFNLTWGALGGLMSLVSAMLVISVKQTLDVVQGVLYSLLVSVGPLVIALSILPGASKKLGGWIEKLVEIASWQIFSAMILHYITATGMSAYHQDSQSNWFEIVICNIVLVVCISLVPKIASALVGGGFGSVAPMLIGAARSSISPIAWIDRGASAYNMGSNAVDFGTRAYNGLKTAFKNNQSQSSDSSGTDAATQSIRQTQTKEHKNTNHEDAQSTSASVNKSSPIMVTPESVSSSNIHTKDNNFNSQPIGKHIANSVDIGKPEADRIKNIKTPNYNNSQKNFKVKDTQ